MRGVLGVWEHPNQCLQFIYNYYYHYVKRVGKRVPTQNHGHFFSCQYNATIRDGENALNYAGKSLNSRICGRAHAAFAYLTPNPL